MSAFNMNHDYRPRDIDANFAQEERIVSFVKSTYRLLALSLLSATLGSLVALTNGAFSSIATSPFMIIIIEIALIFGIVATAKKSPVLSMVLLMCFTFVTGVSIAPILSYAIGIGATGAVINAFLSSTAIFVILSLFAVKTTRDFTQYGRVLIIALIVVVIISLLNVFIFKTAMLSLVVSGACVILFSFFIVFDTQRLIRGQFMTPIEGALALYLDFFNLFISLLQIILIFTGNSSRND